MAERPGWARALRQVHASHGVSPGAQLAIIWRESSFRARARPPRRRILGLIPGPRPSSAYGYGQALDGTWGEYRRDGGGLLARRTSFGETCRFIGWYARRAHLKVGIAPDDVRGLYAAYQVGLAGYRRGRHLSRSRVMVRTDQVARRAAAYDAQLSRCPAAS